MLSLVGIVTVGLTSIIGLILSVVGLIVSKSKKQMVILRITGDFYTLRSVDNCGSGIRLKAHRLFATKEEAEAVMDSERKKRDSGFGRPRRWYE